jgi:hypothetical protein
MNFLERLHNKAELLSLRDQLKRLAVERFGWSANVGEEKVNAVTAHFLNIADWDSALALLKHNDAYITESAPRHTSARCLSCDGGLEPHGYCQQALCDFNNWPQAAGEWQAGAYQLVDQNPRYRRLRVMSSVCLRAGGDACHFDASEYFGSLYLEGGEVALTNVLLAMQKSDWCDCPDIDAIALYFDGGGKGLGQEGVRTLLHQAYQQSLNSGDGKGSDKAFINTLDAKSLYAWLHRYHPTIASSLEGMG